MSNSQYSKSCLLVSSTSPSKVPLTMERNVFDMVPRACQRGLYLKSRIFSLVEFLNILRKRFGDTLEEIEYAMTFTSFTSVDDNILVKQALQKVGNKTILMD